MRHLKVFVAGLATVFAAAVAPATSNRIFISTTGNNSNDCSNPLTPCVDFTGAMSQVNTGGEIIAQATGPYGPLNITKAITISGPPGVVIYSGHQVTVNAPGATVVLRGLTIDGTGALENGINVVAVGALHVESCLIAGFSGSSTTQGNGLFFGSAGNLFVKDTIVRGNGNNGIAVAPSSGTAKASIDNCRLEGNSSGLAAYNNAVITVTDSVASGNSFFGFGCLSSAELNIESCVAANNQYGVYGPDSTVLTIRISNTTVTDNLWGLFVSFANSFLTRGNNTIEGNGTNGAFNGTFSAK
jgi:hypothetical protein